MNEKKSKKRGPSLRSLERIMEEGVAHVACTARCGERASIEPDGDYPCTREGCKGRLVSPLVRAGII